LNATQPHVVRPLPTKDDQFFWDGVARGELRLRRCADCGRARHPAGPMCPACGSAEAEVFEPEPRGVLLSWIVPRHPPAAFPEQSVIALVELTCGARLVSNLRVDDPGGIRPDMPVEFFFDTVDGFTLPQVRPAGAGEA
jgi:uncharacterized OB-fold protein